MCWYMAIHMNGQTHGYHPPPTKNRCLPDWAYHVPRWNGPDHGTMYISGNREILNVETWERQLS